MATPDEMRAAIDAARDELRSAIKGAATFWEKKPATGEGEAAWSPRQAAEHVVAAHVWYANAVCVACGYPGPERFQPAFATAEEAETGLARAVELSQGKLKHITDKDLLMKHERMGSVEQIMAGDAAHLRDHAAQIRAATSA